MPRRGRAAPPISLFSFQDIITSVAGIIILMTLMLAMELLQRKLSGTPSDVSVLVAPLRQQLAAATQERERLKTRLEQQAADAQQLVAASPQRLEQEQAAAEELARRLEQELQALTPQEQEAKRRVEQARSADAAQIAERQRLAELREKIQEQKDETQRLRQQNRIIYNPAPGNSKAAWLVDLSADRLQAAALGKTAPPQVFAGVSATARIRSFLEWAKLRDAGREYFVLLVRPSAVTAFDEVYKELRAAGFDIGFDCIAADVSVIDPVRGAAYQ
jgi:hypothetical protein